MAVVELLEEQEIVGQHAKEYVAYQARPRTGHRHPPRQRTAVSLRVCLLDSNSIGLMGREGMIRGR